MSQDRAGSSAERSEPLLALGRWSFVPAPKKVGEGRAISSSKMTASSSL